MVLLLLLGLLRLHVGLLLLLLLLLKIDGRVVDDFLASRVCHHLLVMILTLTVWLLRRYLSRHLVLWMLWRLCAGVTMVGRLRMAAGMSSWNDSGVAASVRGVLAGISTVMRLLVTVVRCN